MRCVTTLADLSDPRARAQSIWSRVQQGKRRPQEASASAAQVDIWSTGTVLAREKVSYWRETVCSAVFGISVETMPEQFSARIAARNVGPLRFAVSKSTEYRIARSRQDIDAEPFGSLLDLPATGGSNRLVE